MTISSATCSVLWKVSLFSILLISALGCENSNGEDEDDLVGNWIELSDFDGVPRSSATGFSIGTKAYVGTGFDGRNRLKDFWEYDSETNNWTRKSDFPGIARNGAIGFAIDSKGYIGTGYDGVNRLKDFYEYDPATDTWTQKMDFGGTPRYAGVAVSVNGKGYAGTGDDGNYLKDWWEYDPSADTWTQKVSLGGAKRRSAVAFVLNGKGYVCTGVNNGVYEDDLWEYDPSVDQWIKKRPISAVSDETYDDGYTDIAGANKVAFSVDGKAYVATGGKGTVGTSVWEYDPASDLWQSKTSLEASARIEAIGFSIGELGFITTGRNASYYFDDLLGFQPGREPQSLDKKGSIVAP